MAAAGIVDGIAIGFALVGIGYGMRQVVRQVLDPAAQRWLARCDAASGRASRGLCADASAAKQDELRRAAPARAADLRQPTAPLAIS